MTLHEVPENMTLGSLLSSVKKMSQDEASKSKKNAERHAQFLSWITDKKQDKIEEHLSKAKIGFKKILDDEEDGEI